MSSLLVLLTDLPLPSAGKPTLARAVAARLSETNTPTVALGGDVPRDGQCADLGHSPADHVRPRARRLSLPVYPLLDQPLRLHRFLYFGSCADAGEVVFDFWPGAEIDFMNVGPIEDVE